MALAFGILPAGEIISGGIRAVYLRSGGNPLLADAGSGLRLPAFGLSYRNALSGGDCWFVYDSTYPVSYSGNRSYSEDFSIYLSGFNLWSGYAGSGVYLGSGGSLVYRSAVVPTAQSYQTIGFALSGGLQFDIGDVSTFDFHAVCPYHVLSGNIGSGQIASGHLASGLLSNLGGGLSSGAVTSGHIGVTQTPDGTKFLRDDFSWRNPPGGSAAFPVGSVFIAVVATDPAELLGYGTWSAFGAGKMLIGLDSGDTDFDTAEETGGAKTVTLTEAQIPAHTHVQNAHSHVISHVRSATTGGATTLIARTSDASSTVGADCLTDAATPTNQNTGGGGAHNNMPPFIVVYMWKRTA